MNDLNSQENKEIIHKLVVNAVVDTNSQNTVGELGNATTLFEQHNIVKVIEISGASHTPRCQLLQGVAKAKGTVPNSQQWQLVADDIPMLILQLMTPLFLKNRTEETINC